MTNPETGATTNTVARSKTEAMEQIDARGQWPEIDREMLEADFRTLASPAEEEEYLDSVEQEKLYLLQTDAEIIGEAMEEMEREAAKARENAGLYYEQMKGAEARLAEMVEAGVWKDARLETLEKYRTQANANAETQQRENERLSEMLNRRDAEIREVSRDAERWNKQAEEQAREMARLKSTILDIMTTPTVIEIRGGMVSDWSITRGVFVRIIDRDTDEIMELDSDPIVYG